MNKKKGISLIVLVITIVVMIILAGAVILTLRNSGTIDMAGQAVDDTDLKQLQHIATMAWTDAYIDSQSNPAIDSTEIERRVLAALDQAGMDKTRYEIILSTRGVEVVDKLGGSTVKPKPSNPNAGQLIITPGRVERVIYRGTPETINLTASATNLTGDIVWSSDNEGVASVAGQGKTSFVTLHEAGTAIITAKCGNVTSTCTVVVTIEDPSPAITLNITKLNVSMKLEETVTKTIKATLINSKENIEWSIDNEAVATVTADKDVATLTIKGEGVATLTAKAGDVSTTCKITVEDWKQSVSAVVDGVPIPKGFVASPYAGENTKNGGLVIYALTATEIANGDKDIATIDGSKLNSQKTRNQFVWIPVNPDNFRTEFVRKDYTNFGYNIATKAGNSSGFWELSLSSLTNMPTESNNNSSYMTTESYNEAVAMYASVKKYGGYYVGRYEVGADSLAAKTDLGYTEYIANINTPLTVTIGKYPCTYQVATKAISISRSLYPSTGTTYGAVSTLMYGVQWDRMIGWWLEQDPTLDVNDSTAYGNYRNAYLPKTQMNSTAWYAPSNYYTWPQGTTKPVGNGWLFKTGSFTTVCKYNIYDAAGNLEEWTMEKTTESSNVYYTTRGGDFNNNYRESIGKRQIVGRPNATELYQVGFRPALYIK